MDFFGLLLDARFAAAVAAVLLGGFLRGFVGFGAALVIVPMLGLAYGPRVAVTASTVMGIPTLLQLLPDAIRHSERAIVGPVALAIFAAAPLGTWILWSSDAALMKIVISTLVVVMVIMLARGWRLERAVGLPVLVGAGLAGGLVQGIAGIGGPPVVAVALSRPGSPTEQRGNILALMTAISLASVVPQWWHGMFTHEAITLGLAMLPVYGLAILAGSRYFAKCGERHYRQAALATLLLVGIGTLLLAVRDYLG